MRIEAAKADDLAAIEAIEAACFSDPWPQAVIEHRLDSFLVAKTDGGDVMGYLSFSSVLDEGSIDNVAVAVAYRRQGAADALMNAALDRARTLGLAFITLEVRASNEAAIALYQKHGYAEVGRRKNYYQAPREDAILMTRFL